MAAALAAFATVPQGLRANRGLTTTVKTGSVSLVSKLTSQRNYCLQQCSATPTLAREVRCWPLSEEAPQILDLSCKSKALKMSHAALIVHDNM